MQRFVMLAVVFSTLAATPDRLWAAPRWCVANRPDSVFCEDWDRYCPDMLNDPVEACPDHSNNSAAYWLANAVWQSGGAGCWGLSIEDAMFSTAPFSGRANGSGDLGTTKMPLSSFIRNKFGQAYARIMGTDLAPLIMEGILDCPHDAGKAAAMNTYMELANGADQPLTDHIRPNDCVPCGCSANACDKLVIICRQSPTPSSSYGSCPPVATAPILPSIACGALSYLDSNPCHCGESGDHFSYNRHLNFFDGKQWWILKQSLFPGTFQGSGNFVLYASKASDPDGYSVPGPNKIRVTIKSTMVRVELDAKNRDTGVIEQSWCEIPRQYFGPFSLFNMGYAQPCRLKTNGTWECQTIRQCVVAPPGGATTTLDNIAIHGGMGYADPGACCLVRPNDTPPSISCVQADGELDCTETYGGQFKGSGTQCETTPCCPPFLPDHDMDGDVDLEDFGWFQTCLSSSQYVDPPTVPCKCANLDGDIDVDTSDFLIFANCLSGPGVPAIVECIN